MTGAIETSATNKTQQKLQELSQHVHINAFEKFGWVLYIWFVGSPSNWLK